MGDVVMLEELRQEKKYLVFNIGIEKFGIESGKVKEVALCQEAVAMPGQPSTIEGFIKVRGGIVPVLNLRKSFSLPAAVMTEKTRILLVKVEDVVLGIIVDEVLDEMLISTRFIQKPRSVFSLCLRKKYIGGIVNTEAGMIQLISLQEVAAEL